MIRSSLAVTALVLVACAGSAGCGERVDVIVTAPGSPAGSLGSVHKGSTGRFYERDKLYAWVDGARVDVTASAMTLPLRTETVHVVNPWAAIHDDVHAADKGRARLEFGSRIDVVRGAPSTTPASLLYVEGSSVTPRGFVRAADVSTKPPVARELALAGKAALMEKDLAAARTMANAAIEADRDDPGARRLAGAIMNRDGDSAGWALWTSTSPADPPAVGLPASPAATVGPAWVMGSKVSLREKPSTNAARLAVLETGAAVTVQSIDASGKWAEVERATEPPSRVALQWNDLVDGMNPWATATPAQPAERTGGVAGVVDAGIVDAGMVDAGVVDAVVDVVDPAPAILRGFIATELLSSAPPEHATLRSLGIERVAQRRFDEAVVPLTRALSLRPDDKEALEALFQAAVETERYVLALETLDALQSPPASTSGATVEVQRVRGCFGDVAKARERIEELPLDVQPPRWSETRTAGPGDRDYATFAFDAGQLQLPTGEDVCFIDRDGDDERACAARPQVEDEQPYAGSFCGNDVEVTPEIHAAYLAYVEAQQKVVDAYDKLWPDYTAAHDAWATALDQKMSRPAFVVTLQNHEAQPARTLGVFRHHWYTSRWCGQLQECERTDLAIKTLHLPPMAANTSYEIWIEGVDLSHAWGAVILANADEAAELVTEASRKWGDRDPRPDEVECRQLPAKWRDRGAEIGRGHGACEDNDGCCGC